MNTGIDLIKKEREEQILKRLSVMPSDWDDTISLKMCSKSYKERLIIAGALIAAELDRLTAIGE